MGLVKKTTGFVTSSRCFVVELNRKCDGGHDHVPLMAGRAAAAQVYPEMLCEACCRGVVRQKKFESARRGSLRADCRMWASRVLFNTCVICKGEVRTKTKAVCRPA